MRRAFSLIELMIVIMIIGVVYTLVISKLKSVNEEKITPSFLHLKEYLLREAKDAKSVTIRCFDDCKECAIYSDDTKIKEIESWFATPPSIYRYDALQGAVAAQEQVFFNSEGVEESLCFSFSVARDGISEQVIILDKERAYDYRDPFSMQARVYEQLSDFIDENEKLIQEVKQ